MSSQLRNVGSLTGALMAGGYQPVIDARHPHQQAAAERLGARIGAHPGADVVIEETGSDTGMARCCEVVRPAPGLRRRWRSIERIDQGGHRALRAPLESRLSQAIRAPASFSAVTFARERIKFARISLSSKSRKARLPPELEARAAEGARRRTTEPSQHRRPQGGPRTGFCRSHRRSPCRCHHGLARRPRLHVTLQSSGLRPIPGERHLLISGLRLCTTGMRRPSTGFSPPRRDEPGPARSGPGSRSAFGRA